MYDPETSVGMKTSNLLGGIWREECRWDINVLEEIKRYCSKRNISTARTHSLTPDTPLIYDAVTSRTLPTITSPTNGANNMSRNDTAGVSGVRGVSGVSGVS
jgi:hypothetical protein